MKTSSCKAKGRRACAEVKEQMLLAAPHLQSDDIVVTSSGDTGEDLKLSPAARAVFPFAAEVKNVEALNVWKALEQAEGHSVTHTPVLFFRRNRSKLYAAVDARVLLQLYADKVELDSKIVDQLLRPKKLEDTKG